MDAIRVSEFVETAFQRFGAPAIQPIDQEPERANLMIHTPKGEAFLITIERHAEADIDFG